MFFCSRCSRQAPKALLFAVLVIILFFFLFGYFLFLWFSCGLGPRFFFFIFFSTFFRLRAFNRFFYHHLLILRCVRCFSRLRNFRVGNFFCFGFFQRHILFCSICTHINF